MSHYQLSEIIRMGPHFGMRKIMQYFLCSREFEYLSSLKHIFMACDKVNRSCNDMHKVCVIDDSSIELEEKDFLGRSNSGFDIQFSLDIFNF